MRSFLLILTISLGIASFAQITPAPDRDEGERPFDQLIIRGAMLINGNGPPPIGPADIVIKGNRIVSVRAVGYPGVEINPDRRPKLEEGGREIDAPGMYVLPGFVDIHGHMGGTSQGTPAKYAFKPWMAHGITTIQDPSAGNGLNWVLEHKKNRPFKRIT